MGLILSRVETLSYASKFCFEIRDTKTFVIRHGQDSSKIMSIKLGNNNNNTDLWSSSWLWSRWPICWRCSWWTWIASIWRWAAVLEKWVAVFWRRAVGRRLVTVRCWCPAWPFHRLRLASRTPARIEKIWGPWAVSDSPCRTTFSSGSLCRTLCPSGWAIPGTRSDTQVPMRQFWYTCL